MGARASIKNAFTLIELALVIVMLALLIGTIFSAQTMLRNQRIKQIPNLAMQFHAASTQFREKYQYFPGDKPDAYTTWATLTSSTNGNGNGLIDGTEAYYAWEQLVAGGYIVGPYGHSSSQVPNTDVPAGVIEGTGYAFKAGSSPTGLVTGTGNASATFDGNYTAAIYFGKSLTNLTSFMDPGVSGEDAWHIDTLYDDGVPSTGNIMTWRQYGSTTGCYNSGTSAYYIDKKTLVCSFIFLNPYLNRFQ